MERNRAGGNGPMSEALAALATGHATSRFSEDVAKSRDALRGQIEGRRGLVVGGAGSIGSATLLTLLPFRPAAVDVIDQDENGLAELVRDARSRGAVHASTQLRLLPLDYGSPLAERFVRDAGRYDFVLHFAALKHVRSEKDPVTILQMLDTNVLKQRRLMRWLGEAPPARYFAVSTDKAANPVNFMGASKRLMEQLIFTVAIAPLGSAARTSARFANVAFSAGSLLAGWRARVEKYQPLAVPTGTKRYFVSMAEAADICVLAAFAVGDAHLAVPRLSAEGDLRELASVAEAFVKSLGRSAAWYDDERSARDGAARDIAGGRWPVLRTPRDTDGEKAAEEFIGVGESAIEAGFAALRAIPQLGTDAARLAAALDELQSWVSDAATRPGRDEIARVIGGVVSEFSHAAAGKSLDDRM